MKHAAHHLMQVGNAASQLINTLAGGWSDESLSSRTWRMHSARPAHRGWAALRIGIDALLRPLGPDHCQRAYIAEVQRSQTHPALRGRQ